MNSNSDKGCDHEKLSFDIIAPEDGSYYVYFSNESEKVWEVFFDDFKVTLDQKYVSETTDFYPFGLVMRQSRFNIEESYRFGYQGHFSEEDDETGWNSFELRMYDAVKGRWNATDPAGQFYSSYLGMGNNPISLVDPDGAWIKPIAWIMNGFSSNELQNPTGAWNGWGFNKATGNMVDVPVFNDMTGTAKHSIPEYAFTDGLSKDYFSNGGFWGLAWNKNMRNIVPDVITLDVSWGASFPIGASNSYTLNLITRGEDVGFYGTQTVTGFFTSPGDWRYGAEIDGGFNLGGLWYGGNPTNLRFNDLLGKTRVTSAGFGIGANYIEGFSSEGHVVIHGFSAGVGVILGVSHGIGTTKD